MSQSIDASILTHFSYLDDPRNSRGKDHLLLDIITIALCAVISGAEGWEGIAEYGRAKQEWLSTFRPCPMGFPVRIRLDECLLGLTRRRCRIAFSVG